jgi:hypothetical protein
MGNAAGTDSEFGSARGSEQGLAGVRLQNALPRACVLYASATGATKPENLSYASRLGLWGPGTAFADRDLFLSSMEEGGVAALEIVARDLKAMGLYTARALSFAGVEYEPLVHKLTSSRSPFTMPSRTHGPSCIGISKRCSRRQTSSIAYRARPSIPVPRDRRSAGSKVPSSGFGWLF